MKMDFIFLTQRRTDDGKMIPPDLLNSFTFKDISEYNSLKKISIGKNEYGAGNFGELEERVNLGKSFDENTFLVYDGSLEEKGIVLSRNAVNAAMLSPIMGMAPVNFSGLQLIPRHISYSPIAKEQQKILFIVAHPDEEFLSLVHPHKRNGDKVHIYSMTDIFSWGERNDMKTEELEDILLNNLNADWFNHAGFKLGKLYDMKKGRLEENIGLTIDDLKPDAVISLFAQIHERVSF